MEKIPLPTQLAISDGDKQNTSILTIEPCFPGYGTTIGNSIRRHLLASLPGAAVTSFKIKGVLHEFSTLPNIKEDIIEISLNLKKLRLKLFSDSPVKIFLNASGEKKVTAGNIEPNSDVEIINKELHICTLTDKKASVEMEMLVSQGRGYLPTEAREKEELDPGFISIDANFSPIEKVGFTIENVRVGHMTNWDKLIFSITTDGTITPREAVNFSVKDLIDHFNFIENNTRTSVEVREKKDDSSTDSGTNGKKDDEKNDEAEEGEETKKKKKSKKSE